MDVSLIKESWKVDAKIDRLQIMDEILKTPLLHSKYLNWLIDIKQIYRETESKIISMNRLKSRYYKGEFSKEELITHNLEQWQGVKPLKFELENLLNSDPDIILLTTELNECKICLDALESIIKTIASRSYDIKTFIEAEKFYNGR
jgi:hypothetical protein